MKTIFHLIVAISKQNNGIGYQNDLLFRSKQDTNFFRKITQLKRDVVNKNAVIMGRKTWESIPEQYKPLNKRTNIIISKNKYLELQEQYGLNDLENKNHSILVFPNLETCLSKVSEGIFENIYVMGGSNIYKYFLDHNICHMLHITEIECQDAINTDTYFPVEIESLSKKYVLQNVSNMYTEKNVFSPANNTFLGKITLNIKTYINKNLYANSQHCNNIISNLSKLTQQNHDENSYLKLLEKILSQGSIRETRSGKTISLFGEKLEFDVENFFPLLTTKKMFFKGVREELLWFLQANTNAKDLSDKGVKIWEGNSSREYLDKIGLHHYPEGDCGPIYGFQWRHFNAKYSGSDKDYSGKGVDQIAEIIHLIRNNPNSRRIFMSGWNPEQMSEMALPPCHVSYQFYVDGDYLSCQMYQRSGDMFLGIPFNIASTSLLLYLIAKIVDLKPKKVVLVLGDAHIYHNHLSQVTEQISRIPYAFPKLEIIRRVSDPAEYTSADIKITGYKYHPRIPATMAV